MLYRNEFHLKVCRYKVSGSASQLLKPAFAAIVQFLCSTSSKELLKRSLPGRVCQLDEEGFQRLGIGSRFDGHETDRLIGQLLPSKKGELDFKLRTPPLTSVREGLKMKNN